MLGFINRKIFGTQSERILKRFQPVVDKINALEPRISALSDAQLRDKTPEFKKYVADKRKTFSGEIEQLRRELQEVVMPEEKQKVRLKIKDVKNKILEGIIPEAFAVVREAGKRQVNMRHFDVQLLGGLTLHEGMIAEMATGEGKTLVATLTAYLNALLGEGVHIVTVNDYLARRDRKWMGPIYESLGLSVGAIQHDMPDDLRRQAYSSDVTYGTNNEFGFDYLRDNMKFEKSAMVQRGFAYAILDEVDSILVDESRTPLIISGPAEESTDKYYKVNEVVNRLKGRKITDAEEIDAKYKPDIDLEKGYDYLANEKSHDIRLTEEGQSKIEHMLGIDSLYDDVRSDWARHAHQALRAREFFKPDRDYMVKEGQVLIVDEFTGRIMPGRRWSDGLHQAIEAKEGVRIERENQTLATVTFQNYFRKYEKLAGMTGTAATEAAEFHHTYKLDVVSIPTNVPLVRYNYADVIYKTEEEKFAAVVEEIVEVNKAGRPVLVGTTSIEKSERLSELLNLKGIRHHVLNAKYHEKEAYIVAQAGRKSAVTIATNMAGRGTDIVLGGNSEYIAEDFLRQQKILPADPAYREERRKLIEKFKTESDQEHKEVVGAGGLHITGTERHEARRIDNQLRGRAGRQGDPGSSRFYLSLEDDLMRLFASDRIAKLMEFFKWEKGVPIEHPWISKSVETAQKRVEEQNFAIRKELLKYDNIMNHQREVIYGERRKILEAGDLAGYMSGIIEEVIDLVVGMYVNENLPEEQWNLLGLIKHLKSKFQLHFEINQLEAKNKEQLKLAIREKVNQVYKEKENQLGKENFIHLQRMILLQVIDAKWKDHLYAMDHLKEGIHLRAYAQRDPLVEYRNEARNAFEDMAYRIKEEVLTFIMRIQAVKEEKISGVFESLPQELIHQQRRSFSAPEVTPDLAPQPPKGLSPSPEPSRPFQREGKKIGRNDPCPCGSGKKYKKCCGK